MPSVISRVYGGYKDALDYSRERYEKISTRRAENAKKFYHDFFNKLMIDFSQVKDPSQARVLKMAVRQVLGSDKVTFAAIDGTSFKDQLEDFMIFFGGAYAVKGEISFEGNPPKTAYRKWSSKEDVSMVAYVPIPYADLNDVSEDQFIMQPDNVRFDLLSIHTKLMQLAEVFLLYSIIDNPSYRPDFVIWDQSMSGVMMSVDTRPEDIHMIGNTVMGTKINYQDAVIAYSRPYNEDLNVPYPRIVEIYDYILRRLMKDREIDLQQVSNEIGIDKSSILSRIKKYILDPHSDTEPIAKLDGDKLTVNPVWINSWNNSLALFKNFCHRLFNEKDSTVLVYERYDESGRQRESWISPTDLTYLIAIGIRAVIELAWKNRCFLVGIVKDSASTYLSQHYLGTMREIKSDGYVFDDIALPWSDRLFLQSLPRDIESIRAPWATIEYDSMFMTVHVTRDPKTKEHQIVGMRGNIVNKERIMMRSLAQFYIRRDGKKLNMGHVIFIDRLLLPHQERSLKQAEIKTKEVGTLRPFYFKDKDDKNMVQEVMMYVLNTLTRNLYPEVIGYPDPLHKADWGAKSMNRKVQKMIRSSGKLLRVRPLSKTLRQERGGKR